VRHSDHALRRMVAKIPLMSRLDFDFIMDGFSELHRAKILILLKELEGENVDASDLSELQLNHTPLLVPDNLSPWLVARVNGNPAAGDVVVEQFSMTAYATATLRKCATELVPQPKTKSARPSLFSKLWRRATDDRLAG
jgi:hypothetical protein